MTWGELGTLASILGVFIGASAVVQAWLSSRTVTAMHRETQATLTRMDASTQETLRQLGEGVKGIGEGQTRLGEILARMDQAAEQRYRDLRDRLGGGTEAPRC
jgi:hypothetical protein